MCIVCFVCMFVHVCMYLYVYVLATSHSPTLKPFLQIPLFLPILFVHAVFGVVGNLFFVFFFLSIYLCYLLRWWWCIMIVFKMTSIRCNAHIRCHFRSYKTSYKSIFLYILYIIYIGTFNVTETIFCTCTTIYPVVVYTFMS